MPHFVRFLAPGLIALALSCATSVSIASDCPPESGDRCTVAGELRDSRAVAVVRVVKAQVLPGDDADDDYFGGDLYTLAPLEVLKGTLPDRFVLFSENSSGRFPLEVGKDYLLFLDRGHDAVSWRVTSGWRGNSGLLADRQATLAKVRAQLGPR